MFRTLVLCSRDGSIDERPDGVHLSYDRMASFLKAYGNSEALKVAKAIRSTVGAGNGSWRIRERLG